jgi:nucleotide-binding universal stress UspA family protein
MTEPGEPRRILLAVDLPPASRDAVDEAIARAKADGAQLIVLSVVEQHNLHLPGGIARRVDQERDRLTAGAQAIVGRARNVGVRATFLIWEGDPAEAIVDAARSEDADVIILGSRPRLNVRRLILGSVSSEVARRATCEVIVVPSGGSGTSAPGGVIRSQPSRREAGR